MKIQILPSLLAADFGNLEAGARQAEVSGGDALHVDIMDAHFVPNLSMGPDVVAMADRVVTIPLSVHLMMTNPERYVDRFAEAGADSLLVHVEIEADVGRVLKQIRDAGLRPGITLNPETPAAQVFPVLDQVEEVLCMTVRPGYGGQSFMAEVLPKIADVRRRANSIGKRDLDILVDGGIGRDTVTLCAEHGANAFVAGTSLFRATDMASEVNVLRDQAADAWTRHGDPAGEAGSP